MPEGITKDQSSDYQKIASIPKGIFEKAVAQPGASTASMVRLAEELKRVAETGDPEPETVVATSSPRRGLPLQVFAEPRPVVSQRDDSPTQPVDDPRYVTLMKFSRAAERLCEQFSDDSLSVGIHELGKQARLLALSIANSITQEQEGEQDRKSVV